MSSTTNDVIADFLRGWVTRDPHFVQTAAAFGGWQRLAQNALMEQFRSFLSLLSPEQLADVAAGRVDIAVIAQNLSR